MKKLILLFLFFIPLASSSAADKAEQEEVNPEQTSGETVIFKECSKNTLSTTTITDWIKRLQKNYQDLRFLEASFKQSSYLMSLDLSEVSEGKMWFMNPGKLRWEYETPEVQVFLIRDEEFQLYQPTENQVIKQDMRSYFSSDVPVAFLLGLGDLSESFSPVSGCKDGGQVILRLKPKSDKASRDLSFLRLAINSTSYTPEAFEVLDSEGNKTTIVLDKLKENQKLASNVFTLELPRGVDEQDLRQQAG